MEQKIAGCSVMLELLIGYSNLYFTDTINTDDQSSRAGCRDFGKYCELGMAGRLLRSARWAHAAMQERTERFVRLKPGF
jgi:hypothetical protein